MDRNPNPRAPLNPADKKPPKPTGFGGFGPSAIKVSVKTQSYPWFASREQGLSYNDSKLCMEKEYLDV